MEKPTQTKLLAAILGVLFFALPLPAQTTVFTYQGHLTEQGSPADGVFDLQFQMFDAESGGTRIGDAFAADDVRVTDGAFTVMLDFGGAFDGGDRFLAISVRPDGAAEFTSLAPRQPITATPYAIRAREASTLPAASITTEMLAPGAVTQLGTPDGSNPAALTVDETGSIGVGTTEPQAGLHIATGKPLERLQVLSVIENGSPANPDLGNDITTAVHGDLLAIVSRWKPKIALVDITTREAPHLLSTIDFEDHETSPLNAVDVTDSVLAIGSLGGLYLVDISTPTNPTIASALSSNMEAYSNLSHIAEVIIEGSLLAAASYENETVTLIDISTISAPKILSTIPIRRVFELAMDADLLAIGSTSRNEAEAAPVTLFDISQPASPQQVSTIGSAEGVHSATSISLENNLLALQTLEDVRLIDLSDMMAPRLVSTTATMNTGYGFGGSGALILRDSRLAVANQSYESVALLDVQNPEHPVLISGAINQLNGFNRMGNPSQLHLTSGDVIATGTGDFGGISILRSTRSGRGSLHTTGWVGLGTSLPLAPLHVSGNLMVSDATEVSLQTRSLSIGRFNNHIGNAFVIGSRNTAEGDHPVAIGFENTSTGDYSTTIGWGSRATMETSTAIGFHNSALEIAAIAMGSDTTASGYASTSMGLSTTALGSTSTAMGRQAMALHDGTFVWGDKTPEEFESTAENQFLVRAGGGVGINTNTPEGSLHVAGNLMVSDATEVSLQTFSLSIGMSNNPVGDAFVIGSRNTAEGDHPVAIGYENTSIGAYSTTMGWGNKATRETAAAIGSHNKALNVSAIAMGEDTTASGHASTSMGLKTTASGFFSTAMGRQAMALHDGTFVWGDKTPEDFESTDENQFLIRAGGGVGINTNAPETALHVNGTVTATTFNPSSDRNLKENINPIDTGEVLAKVASLPIARWNFKDDDASHVGPMAQDFHEAFGLGTDDRHIATVDADGVALAAIQGLHQKIEEKDAEIEQLRRDIIELKAAIQAMTAKGGRE